MPVVMVRPMVMAMLMVMAMVIIVITIVKTDYGCCRCTLSLITVIQAMMMTAILMTVLINGRCFMIRHVSAIMVAIVMAMMATAVKGWHQYVVRVDDVNFLSEIHQNKGRQTSRHPYRYRVPLC